MTVIMQYLWFIMLTMLGFDRLQIFINPVLRHNKISISRSIATGHRRAARNIGCIATTIITTFPYLLFSRLNCGITSAKIMLVLFETPAGYSLFKV